MGTLEGLASVVTAMRNRNAKRFHFGTKAETLERVKPLIQKSTVPDLYYFTVADWEQSEDIVLKAIKKHFQEKSLAIRSSASNEDGQFRSMAGAFESHLDVNGNDEEAVRAAIQLVIQSYSGNPYDQVLVQPMLKDVALSGVMMTYDLDTGAPYYILNYDDESGKTDRITGGIGVNKTVVVHRDFALSHIESPRVAHIIEMTRELEQICGPREPLDIEFAQTKDGRLYLLQMRRISVQKNWNRRIQRQISESIFQVEQVVAQRLLPRPGLAGSTTIFGQMPDWNPAEIIGTSPRPLATSLYRDLITDHVWQEARTKMGYRAIPNERLMVLLAGHPYIDVRNSFNSFLPSDLDFEVEKLLVDAWLARLFKKPELHDKVEFEVAQTVLDFRFEQTFQERYAGVLSAQQYEHYKSGLLRLTKSNINLSQAGTLNYALKKIGQLKQLQGRSVPSRNGYGSPIWQVVTLLNECQRLGTLPFAMIARHAFIAEALLRSAVYRCAITSERLDEFKLSLVTVAGQLAHDFEKVATGQLKKSAFLKRYGHLRPGTYDILSLRYDQREDLFHDLHAPQTHREVERFVLTPQEKEALTALLADAKLDHLEPEALLYYAELSIVERENSKFVFTKHLSDALELIAQWGEEIGLSRDDLSYLTLPEIVDTLHSTTWEALEICLQDIVDARRQMAQLARSIRLGYIIRDVRDIYVVPLHRSAPNFVTSKAIEGQVVWLDTHTTGQIDLFKRIACIENADPGFDWIFTRGISGLITKFGGANSHMTIRCAELGLPAAIGVGEQTFERIVKAGQVELNCADRMVRPSYG